jgi:bacterioferritin-associated ferredoxin
MYVCVCNGLTERDVRSAARSCTRRQPKDVYGHLGCSVECGSCVSHARRVIATEIQNKTALLLAAE